MRTYNSCHYLSCVYVENEDKEVLMKINYYTIVGNIFMLIALSFLVFFVGYLLYDWALAPIVERVVHWIAEEPGTRNVVAASPFFCAGFALTAAVLLDKGEKQGGEE